MSNKHEGPLRRLIPLKLEGDFESIIKVQARALDKVQDKIDYIELNILPDNATDNDILTRWELLLDLPTPSGATTELRNFAIISKLNQTGGLSKAYFENLASFYGYTIEFVDSVKLFRAGISRAGDATFDGLEGFRALPNDGATIGGLVASEDRSDRELHIAHNDRGQNLRVYEEDQTPRQWVFGMIFFNTTRELADPFIELMLKLKPAETFIEWSFQAVSLEKIEEGDGEKVTLFDDKIDEGDGQKSPIFIDVIDESDGLK